MRSEMSQDVSNARRSNGTEDAVSDDPSSEDASAAELSHLLGEELVLQYPSMDEPVVDGETLMAEPGAVTALIGPNGAGKSTLLKGLAKQLTPEDGSVLVDGRDVYEMGTKELARKPPPLAQETTAPHSIAGDARVPPGRS